MKRLALVKAAHARLGAGSAPSNATHDVLLQIACESGLREHETYARVTRWRDDLARTRDIELEIKELTAQMKELTGQMEELAASKKAQLTELKK